MRIIFYIFVLIMLTACSAEGTRKLPGVYRIDIQQGNVIEQEMLNKLKPGMRKDQVHFIMGTPTIADPFHNERWEYIYTFSRGGNTRQQRHITMYFEEDKLAYLEGGIVKGIRRPPEDYRKERKTVDVPSRHRNQSILSKLINVLPFVGDDQPGHGKPTKPAEESVNEGAEAAPPQIDNEGTETEPGS